MTPVYRMSTVGACSRVLSTARLGFGTEQAPDWLVDIARESTRHESWIVEDLVAEGHIVATCPKCPVCAREGLERSGIHVEYEHALFKLVGHLDGIIVEDATSMRAHFLECKGLSRFRYAAWQKDGLGGFPMFAYQLSAYIMATPELSLPALMVVKNRDTGEKDNVYIEEPPVDPRVIIEKFAWIESNARYNKGSIVSCDTEPDSPLARYCRCPDCPHKASRARR